MSVQTINGKKRYFSRVENFAMTEPGRYTVTTIAGHTFKVVGGKNAGGSRSDWFLSCDDSNIIEGYMNCKSLADALNLIDNI